MMYKKIIDCYCSSAEHCLHLMYFDDEKNSCNHLLYIEVYLQKQKWYKRIWRGIKYIFGYKSRYGDFTEILYDVEKVEELKKFLNDYIEAAPKPPSNSP